MANRPPLHAARGHGRARGADGRGRAGANPTPGSLTDGHLNHQRFYTPLTDVIFVKGPLTIGWLAAIAASGHNKAVWVALAFKSQIDRRREAWVTPPYSILTEVYRDALGRVSVAGSPARPEPGRAPAG